MFAKPFIAALAHDDGITCLARNPRRLNCLLSGSADGDIRLWDLPAQRCLRRLVGHSGQVKGLSVTPDGEAVVSCATDCTIKLWKVRRRADVGSVHMCGWGECGDMRSADCASLLPPGLAAASASRQPGGAGLVWKPQSCRPGAPTRPPTCARPAFP
jgi:WD40 repeat protein